MWLGFCQCVKKLEVNALADARIQEYEMRDAIEPGFVYKDGCINQFCEYQYSDWFKMKPVKTKTILVPEWMIKNLVRFQRKICKHGETATRCKTYKTD